jgi:hypothetical protein
VSNERDSFLASCPARVHPTDVPAPLALPSSFHFNARFAFDDIASVGVYVSAIYFSPHPKTNIICMEVFMANFCFEVISFSPPFCGATTKFTFHDQL